MKTIIAGCLLTAAITLAAAESAPSPEPPPAPASSARPAPATPIPSSNKLRDKAQKLNAAAQTSANPIPSFNKLRDSNSSSLGLAREAVPPLIIQFSPVSSENLDRRLEDLAVMTRIFEKALKGSLGEEGVPVKMGVRMLVTGGGRSVRGLSIEGLGPLFLIKVNFPLIAPAEGEPKEAPSVTSDWDKARAEVKGIAPSASEAWPGNAAIYSEEQVEALTETLLAAFKQAAHIRDLKPGDSIAVSVFGPSGAHKNEPGTVLTFRASKADVDAFAKGDLDLAAFRRLTKLNSYKGVGPEISNLMFMHDSAVSRNAPASTSGPGKW